MSNFYTFLKGMAATLLLLVAPATAWADYDSQLGDAVTDLSQLSADKTYAIYNDHFTTYMCYQASASTTNAWAANMIGDEGHALSFTPPTYSATSKAMAWFVTYEDGKLYIKNRANGKYIKTQRGAVTFTDEASPLEVTELSEGTFAFHSTASDIYDYACCAPHLGGSGSPIAWWEASDDGSAWQFVENPNVATFDAAPAALAGKYTVTGKWTTTDADFEVDSYPTSYAATITVAADGHALMTGLVNTPYTFAINHNQQTGNGDRTDSCYVGTWNETDQTLTFTFPEGYVMINDGDYMSWRLKSPFTLKATLADGKYTLTTDSVYFTVNAEKEAAFADVTFAPEQTATPDPDPVNPDQPGGIDAEITLSELAGEYTATVGSYSIDESDGYYKDVKDSFSNAATRTEFTAKITVNEDGTAGLEGFIGDYKNKVGLGQYNTLALPGVWDDSAKTLTFSPKDVKNDYFNDADGNKWRFDLTEPIVLKASVNVGGANYELKADTLKFRFSPRYVSYCSPVTANDVVFSSNFSYVVPEVPADSAPADMAGTYKITTGAFVGDTKDIEVPEAPNTVYATLTVKDGLAHLSSLVGTPYTSYMDDNDAFVMKDTTYVGKYYEKNSIIEFTVPEGYDITVPGADGVWQLQGKIIFNIEKDDNGLYHLTNGNGCFKVDDDYTMNTIGMECQQLATVEFTKEDLIGKWNLNFQVEDEDAEEEGTYIEKNSTFEIAEAEDGSLYMTNFLGTDTKKYPLTLTASGISIASYFDQDSGDLLIGNAQAVANVDFIMLDAKTMQLASQCIFWQDGTSDDSYIMTAATATKAEEAVKFDPAPADLAGRYTITTGAWTSSNEEEFSASEMATKFNGKITVDAEGKVLMTGLLGTPQSASFDPEEMGYVYVDSAYVGYYNAEAQTITFNYPANSDTQYWDMYDEATYQSFACSKPFTVKVEKSDEGLYTLTAADAIEFSVSETYTVSCAGAVFAQQKSYTMTADELVGNWQMKYAATDAYGNETGEEAVTTFTIKKNDEGNLVLTNLAGSDEELAITLKAEGFSLPFTYEVLGEEEDSYYHMVTGNTTTGSDVEFYFSGNDTFTLDTQFMFANKANPDGVVIPAATVATRVVPTLGNAVSSLDELSADSAYVLYNPTDVVYAVYDEAHGTDIWAANVPQQNAFSSSAVDFDITSANQSWMVVKKNDKVAIYNLGAKKYLTTTTDSKLACQLSDDITLLSVVDLGDGKFAFTSNDNDSYSYFCSAAAFPTRLMSTWSSDDHGCSWQFVANPNVAADADIAGEITAINTIIGNASAPAAIYTLGGVRLNATDPTKLQRGVYIVNGRKVIVK